MSTSGLTFSQLRDLTGASGGVSERVIQRVSAPATAEKDALVFAEEGSSLSAALLSSAGAILAWTEAPAGDERILRVRDPRYAFALCARELGRVANLEGQSWIDPAASVHPTASLGRRVHVGAGAVIEAGARLGDDCHIGARAVVHEGVVLGQHVVVQAGAILGSLGFGYVRHKEKGDYLLFPQQGGLIIEDEVEIGANTTIDRGALEETRIGHGTKIDNLVHIGHNCRIGRNVVIAAQVGISGSTVVGDGAVLAGQVGLSDHCHIGPGVILGGQAGVYRGKTVQGPGEIFSGTPAEPLRDQMRALARLRALARSRGKG